MTALAESCDLEGAHQGLVDAHHSSSVVELSAVIRRREQRDQLAFGEELVTVLHHLQNNSRASQTIILHLFLSNTHLTVKH